jgi:putative ABC transport system substrate-binding protein
MLLSRHTKRREFIAGLGGAAAWPVVARAQQRALPIVGFINAASESDSQRSLAAFRAGLAEFGFVEGRNVIVEYHFLGGRDDLVPALVTDWVSRRIAAIATPGYAPAAVAAKALTSTIPIVFGVGEDPVRLGLVASLTHPGGNLTGVNFFTVEVVSKRLGLLHQLVPKAKRIAVVVNPADVLSTDGTLREIEAAAHIIGLTFRVYHASTSLEIEEVFTDLARDQAEALFVSADGYFVSRRVQFVTLATRHGIPTAFSNPIFTETGGLMSYAADIEGMVRQVGTYTARILQGVKPAELPVVQSTRFKFVLNMVTAKALGVDVPPGLLASADEVIE